MRKSKFALGLLVAVVMFAGGVGLFLSHTSAQQPRVIHLTQGWNLVTWTGEPQSAPAALASLGDAVSVVYAYNNDSQIFTRYIVGRPDISTLYNFGPEEAYWVLALRSMDWSAPRGTTPDPWSEECTAFKAEIEIDEVLLDMAEKGALVDTTADEARALLEESQRYFDQHCQGVPLRQPSRLTFNCALGGRWKGMQEAFMISAPFEERMGWINQLDGILDRYCLPQY